MITCILFSCRAYILSAFDKMQAINKRIITLATLKYNLMDEREQMIIFFILIISFVSVFY